MRTPGRGDRGYSPLLLALICLLPMIGLDAHVAFRLGLPMVSRLDFAAFFTAGRIVAAGEARDLYSIDTELTYQRPFTPGMTSPEQVLVFLNPPVVALPFALLAPLSLQTAYMIWSVVNAGVLAYLCWMIVRALPETTRRLRFRLLAACLTFLPVWMAIIHGQLSLLLLVVVTGAWLAMDRGDDFSAGAILSLVIVKPQLLPMPLIALACQRRWRMLGGVGAGISALSLLSLAIVGVSGAHAYGELLTTALTAGDVHGLVPQKTFTWSGFLHRVLPDASPADVLHWWIAGVVPALIILLWALRRRTQGARGPVDLQWALTILVALFVSPHTNFHDLSLQILPAVLIVHYLCGRRAPDWLDRFLWGWLGLGYVIVWFLLYVEIWGPPPFDPVVPTMALTIILLAVRVFRPGVECQRLSPSGS